MGAMEIAPGRSESPDWFVGVPAADPARGRFQGAHDIVTSLERDLNRQQHMATAARNRVRELERELAEVKKKKKQRPGQLRRFRPPEATAAASVAAAADFLSNGLRQRPLTPTRPWAPDEESGKYDEPDTQDGDEEVPVALRPNATAFDLTAAKIALEARADNLRVQISQVVLRPPLDALKLKGLKSELHEVVEAIACLRPSPAELVRPSHDSQAEPTATPRRGHRSAIRFPKGLPKFHPGTTQVDRYFRAMEHKLLPYQLDRELWPSALAVASTDDTLVTWITDKILEPELNWEQAKALFHDRYHDGDALARAAEKLHSDGFRQGPQESADRWRDRLALQAAEAEVNEAHLGRLYASKLLKPLHQAIQQSFLGEDIGQMSLDKLARLAKSAQNMLKRDAKVRKPTPPPATVPRKNRKWCRTCRKDKPRAVYTAHDTTDCPRTKGSHDKSKTTPLSPSVVAKCAKRFPPGSCYNCGEKGHRSKDCKKNCYVCGEQHPRFRCPSYLKWRASQPVSPTSGKPKIRHMEFLDDDDDDSSEES